MEQLRCVVERITYQNPENGYTVIKCRAKGFSDLVTVVGSMADIHVGSVKVLFEGREVEYDISELDELGACIRHQGIMMVIIDRSVS